jgi:hypothetical protein
MITASRVPGRGGNTLKGRRAGAEPCKGTANALDDQVEVMDGRLASTGSEEDQDLLSNVLEELVRGREGYQPHDVISWGSSDLAFVRVVSVWHFPEFVVVQKNHRPSVPALGPEWDEFVAIPFTDNRGIEEFSFRLGFNGTDPEEQ